MNHLDSFRNREVVKGLAGRIAALMREANKPVTFMEVCGTHTMAIHRYGLRSLLPPEVRLISGPGCPVCVTPNSYLDRAVAISRLPDTVIATFGDMVRVPGSSSSLIKERARGADVRVVYSPLDAVAIAAANRDKRVIFLGVGFETTAPTVAASIMTAKAQGLDNYFVLASHKTMPRAMEVLSSDDDLGLDGYLCPAHVSAIVGAAAYGSLCERYHLPCVVTGFEPADVLQGIEMLVRQVAAGKSLVEIQYSRVVKWEGNRKGQEVLDEVFVPFDAEWRGIGIIAGSGLRIADRFAAYDAERCIEVTVEELKEPDGCLCGEILKGKVPPHACPLFGGSCTPDHPAGACMVSSEGACAAAFRYR